MNTYTADTGFWNDGQAWIEWDGKKVAPLPPRLDLANHSPSGFAWGYGGSGPAQLALALLAHAVGDDEVAKAYYMRFKFAVIAKLPQEKGWKLTEKEILDWVEAKQREAASEDRQA